MFCFFPSAWGIIDWGQQILPLYHAETTELYYGKGGIAYFIMCFVFPIPGEEGVTVVKRTVNFDLIFGQKVSQKGDASLGCALYALKKLKEAFPFIKSAELQSDNGSAFHSTECILGLVHAEKLTGIRVTAARFTEAYDGKGECDRLFCFCLLIRTNYFRCLLFSGEPRLPSLSSGDRWIGRATL
jgi:hypothetical protein